MSVKEGVTDESDGDDLTIAEGGRGACPTLGAVLTLQGLIGVIHIGVPNGEDFLPATGCDIIGQAVHRGVPPLVC